MNKNNRWLNVFEEGDVAGDGVNDDGPGIQRAIDKVVSGSASYGPVGGTLVLPPGRFRTSIDLQAPATIRIMGSGGYQSMLFPDPGVTALTVAAHSRSQRRWDVDEYDPIVSEMGTRLNEFGVIGRNGEGNTGIVFESQCDRIVSHDLKVMNCDTGVVINSTGSDGVSYMRESEFYSMSVDNCGTSLGAPALDITTQPTGGVAGDGTNQIYFYGLRTLYNYGPVYIRDVSSEETLRRIQMHGWMLHGRGDRDDLSWGDSCQISACSDIQIYGLMTNGSKAGHANIRLMQGVGPDTTAPRNILIRGSIGNGPGDGIVVESVQGLDMELVSNGNVVGDDVRIEAGALVGNRPAHLRFIGNLEGSAVPHVINIAASERPHIYGYWDGVQRLRQDVEAVDAGGTARMLNVPTGGGTVTAV